MPRSRSTFIQSEVARRRSPRALTAPASWIAPPNSRSFSVSVVLPASGCAMIANVRRFAIGAGSKTSSDMGAESSTVHAKPKAPWVVLLVSSTALARPHTVANGMTDAATNTANVIASGDGKTHMAAVIPPIDANFDWSYIVQCVKAQYKPYNVIITETAPTSGNYVEAVVGGDGASTGWSANSGILGVASADNFSGVTEKGIAFSFELNK